MAVGHDERDPQRFWQSVLDALRATIPGSARVRALTAAPDLDGWAIAERLLTDLAPLTDRIWLVIDDVHELGSAEARRQLELLVMRAPSVLRFVLLTRQDVRLGLHRLRLDGELTEIRAADLRFTLEEARELLDAAGVRLPEPALASLRDRTEGWVAGLRLAGCRWTGARTRSGSWPSSPGASGRWPSTCWPRCWSDNPTRCAGSCCGPRSWSG